MYLMSCELSVIKLLWGSPYALTAEEIREQCFQGNYTLACVQAILNALVHMQLIQVSSRQMYYPAVTKHTYRKKQFFDIFLSFFNAKASERIDKAVIEEINMLIQEQFHL